MKEKDQLLKKIVKELVSEEAIPIVEYLRGKSKISEFVISEELELEIHKTRFLLYKLLDHNIVSFIRKKDKIKGWYICYWDLNEDIVNHLDQKMSDDKLDKLKERLKREEDNQFYMCKNACTRMDFDRAMEFNYKCPECGELMHIQDNSRTISFLKERITELEKEAAKKKGKSATPT
jgi:transcription initiation factor TFIIE subunit alpha